MPVFCTYTLNRKETSPLVCSGFGSVDAYSGHGKDTNNPDFVADVGVGAIPPGTYYIVDRSSGRWFGWVLDDFGAVIGTTDRRKWFMLWNTYTGDATMVHGVKRGLFRLHPDGPHHRSDGCITIKNPADFERLRSYLLARGATMPIPGTDMKAYGRVDVR
ncbi:conserved hypothetical protein [Paraburkholderia piptadeniae]|uniref:Tlde1 domain-containing protein n=1 Tax=Paraburkholderia piptadeniae TaxID=1701573 RepID=A0A1N7RXJ3_9BURK|nr:DUF2778 domain-containing protein [Paraburkholderia piptadeniae]SIT39841.1 conserved hypothetical protein [Paraburkholderia piptadeniae]